MPQPLDAPDTRALHLGMAVEALDGPCGVLADLVVDPRSWLVTHLVVHPPHRHDQARLVPMTVAESTGGRIVLAWSLKEVHAATAVEQTDFVELDEWPHPDDGWDVGITRLLSWPYYSSSSVYGTGMGLALQAGTGPQPMATVWDRIPQGTVEIRRASEVVSSDEHVVGHVDGFVVDPTGTVTHVVLEHGHLWGHREISVPLTAIAQVTTDRVELRVTRDAVGEYPSVPFHRNVSAR